MTPNLREKLQRKSVFRDVPAWRRFVYEILFYFFSLFYLPSFMAKRKWREGMGERFGHITTETRAHLEGRVFWVHAVSVGEMVQALRLVNALRDSFDGYKFLITTTTVTGKEVALKLKNEADEVLYFPIDFRWSVRKFIRAVNPSAVALLETEIWPNLIIELTNRGIPVSIINGRISEKAIQKYRRVKGFLAPVLNRLSTIAVQDEIMKKRFLDLGTDASVVSVTGNMKFDWLPPSRPDPVLNKVDAFRASARFLLVAGSTHEGEEEVLFKIQTTLSKRFEGWRLLLAPRHLTRLDQIEQTAARLGVPVTRLSAWDGSQTGVLLLDQMGVLASAYDYADTVFIGGSLVPFGGHNPVEPAYYEKAILFGPHMNSFRLMAKDFLNASAAIQVNNAEALQRELVSLTENSAQRKEMGQRAKSLILTHQGATERNKKLLIHSMALAE